MYIILDYKTQVSIIPRKRKTKLKKIYYKITKSDLFIFAGLIQNKTIGLPDL
jgi:hypothetical protein